MSYPSEVPVETTSLTNVSLPTSITNQVGNITNLVQSKVEEGVCAAPNLTTPMNAPAPIDENVGHSISPWLNDSTEKVDSIFLPRRNVEDRLVVHQDPNSFFMTQAAKSLPEFDPMKFFAKKKPETWIKDWLTMTENPSTLDTENTATFTLPPSDSSKTAPSLTSSYFLRFLKNNDTAEKLCSEIRNSTYIK
nr:hypothetical protein [Chlamydiota bacterium]